MEPITPHRRRWLPTLRSLAIVLAVILISGLLFVTTSMLTLVAVTAAIVGEVNLATLRDPEAMRQVVGSRVGFPILVVAPQLALILPAIGAVLLSPSSARRRLGLIRGHWPLWAWLAAALAVPLVGMVSGVTVKLFMDESEQLNRMAEVFRQHGESGFLLPLALLVGLTPAVCEELLFRGFAQTRLARTLGPLLGILIASACFAAFHWDPVHVLGVFPIGLFLGWVAWRSGSLFPAMMGHFVNNVTSVFAVVLGPDPESGTLASLPAVMAMLGMLAVSFVGLIASLVAGVIYGRPGADRIHSA